MKRHLFAVLALAMTALSGPAFAADNFQVKDGTAVLITKSSKDVGGVHHERQIMEGVTAGGVATQVKVLSDGTLVADPVVATDAKLATLITRIDSLITALGTPASASGQSTTNGSLSSIDGKLTGLATDAKLEQVRALLASPLAVTLSGVATATNQATANASLASIDGKVTGLATAGGQTTASGKLDALHNDLTKPDLAASGVTPVTGTITGVGSTASFPAKAGRPFNLILYATGSTTPGSSLGGSTVYLARSLDGGTTWLPITASGSTIYSFTTLANETLYEGQTGVLFRLTTSVYGGTSMPFGFFQ
jgi:hypothetical protein